MLDLAEAPVGVGAGLFWHAALGNDVSLDHVAPAGRTPPRNAAATATALEALAPPVETFDRGRGFAAWMGLTPRQHSSGG